MTSNHKLTSVLKGRTITGTGNQGNALTIKLDDSSTLSVQTAGSTNSVSTGGAIQAVQQQQTTLRLEFSGGSHLEIPMAGETSCVMVRDENGKLEYAD